MGAGAVETKICQMWITGKLLNVLAETLSWFSIKFYFHDEGGDDDSYEDDG